MKIFNKREPFILLAGDLAVFTAALWVALALRYAEIPSQELVMLHVFPFSVLFVVWVVAFFIAGLYEKHTLVFKHKLPTLILNTQIINSIIAVVFFYLIPISGVTPKTVLVLFLCVFFALLVSWRTLFASWFGARHREKALLVGVGSEMMELQSEVNSNPRYSLVFVKSIDVSTLSADELLTQILWSVDEGIDVVVIDFNNEKLSEILPLLYEKNVSLVAMSDVYEEVFDRVALSSVDYKWFLEHASSGTHVMYDSMKRFIDVAASSVLGTLSLLIYPLVILAIKFEDGGPAFIVQGRVGENRKVIDLYKFRSMSRNETNLEHAGHNRVTRVGSFLRKTRIDELPQLWNVLKGDLSLVGPRPELQSGVVFYEKEIPYYALRHLVRPGLSGWAQLYHEQHPHHGFDVVETRNKLSYDLFYLKNRSLLLDIAIALKTVKTLLLRTGN